MSDANNLQSEDQFLCSICLDVFTDPVTIPCGHNFCKNCITQHWNINNSCPMCNEVFPTRPEIAINTFISEMVAQFRHGAQQKASSSSEQQSEPGDVPCDLCTGTKLKAVKSCLVCLASYCQPHLEPHLTKSGLKAHQLIDPLENLEDRMCTKHDKPLELFCKTDQTCVCMLCPVLDHKTHDVICLKEEYEGKKAELEGTEAEIQQMIEEKRVKIQEIRHSVDLSRDDADRAIAHGVEVFTTVMEAVERDLNELIEVIEEKQTMKEHQAEDFIKELEEEISELMKRSSEVEQLSRSEDHLHLIRNFPFLKAAPPTKDWTEVSIYPPSCKGTVVEAVIQLDKTISETMKNFIKGELKTVQQYTMDVTLNPDTAHPDLILSDDGKQVSHGNVKKKPPQSPERFSVLPSVLGQQSFSSGRSYFEVQVKGKTDWTLGVVRETVKRKGYIPLSPEEGYWTMWFRNGKEYKALDDPHVCLTLEYHPGKVGVFVDYEEGLVSFYDVDAATLIYSFTDCSFTENLYPYVSPGLTYGGRNATPLIIAHVTE